MVVYYFSTDLGLQSPNGFDGGTFPVLNQETLLATHEEASLPHGSWNSACASLPTLPKLVLRVNEQRPPGTYEFMLTSSWAGHDAWSRATLPRRGFESGRLGHRSGLAAEQSWHCGQARLAALLSCGRVLRSPGTVTEVCLSLWKTALMRRPTACAGGANTEG